MSALGRLWLGGVICAALVGAAGFAIERTRLGSSEAAAFTRVEQSVRAETTAVGTSLAQIASTLAGNSALLEAAATDSGALRELLDRADAAMVNRPQDVAAVTAYGPTGSPVAWSGRPSELSLERIAGPEALFVAPGPLGLRLVYLKPIVESASQRRIGAVAAEQVLSRAQGIRAEAEEVALSTPTLVPVWLKPHQGNGGNRPFTFVLQAANGESLLDARVAPDALRAARQNWRRHVTGFVLAGLAITLVVSVYPLLRLRGQARSARGYLTALGSICAALIAARLLLWAAPVPEWTDQIFQTQAVAPGLRLLFRSPLDFLFTALLSASLIVLAADAVRRLRTTAQRRPVRDRSRDWPIFAISQAATGLVVAVLLVGYQALLGETIAAASVDALHFSLHPWNNTARLAFSLGLMLIHMTVIWGAVLILAMGGLPWTVPRAGLATVAAFGLRALPLVVIFLFPRAVGAAPSLVPLGPTVGAGLACLTLVALVPWARPRYRHASHGLRLAAGALVLLTPAFILYPSVVRFADRGLRRQIEERFGVEALTQRSQLRGKLSTALMQIDRMVLPSLVAHAATEPVSSHAAFRVWSQTILANERLTSSVELFAPDGSLVSRFALNLPEYAASDQKWQEQSCQWALLEEVSPFGSEERRLLHAGRRLCDESGQPDAVNGGSVVVHIMLDYNALSFITSRAPYSEVIRPGTQPQQEDSSERDLQFVVYGWGRRPLYTSGGTGWPLREELLGTIALSRRPFWTTIAEGDTRYETYILNDRAGIYVLGYPSLTPLDHLINLAELTILGATGYVLLLAAAGLLALIGGRTASTGRELLREVRASFYRKLFLAFLAASLVPVVILAFVTRTFFAAQLRAGIDSDAVRTAVVAQRVVEEYVSLQRGAGGVSTPDDDIMVSLSHAINQDVNIFSGSRLLATSVRDLFESGLLPVRTPNPVYRAIVIDRVSSFVGDEVAGDIPYTLAATPVRIGDGEAILTVPLALRQQEIEREIDRLDRRVVLAALLFVVLGGFIGYSMAERIGDPVNRLTRATRRIARGDLSARIVLTSSDELRRLVEDFNRMAADLQRQRVELERTHRLEAWAEMARQVAHEIKNPLTPIQLSSEHLLRVHKDRGEPLSPILEECMNAILSQVKLLRQISAEFSSFASSPTAHPVHTSLPELISTVIEPYRTGLGARVSIDTDMPADLPPLLVDRTLLSRALTNIIENALQAMPGGGALAITARADAPTVRLSVADTGSGMDEEALRRIFEPYFSTKAAGTGLGLTIAKRNVEIQGGTIGVRSTPGQGTTVTLDLPTESGIGNQASGIGIERVPDARRPTPESRQR